MLKQECSRVKLLLTFCHSQASLGALDINSFHVPSTGWPHSRSGLCLQFGPGASRDNFVLFSEGIRSQRDRGDSENCINKQEPQMINPRPGFSHMFSLL